MATVKVTDLTAATSVTDDDVFPFTDSPGATPASKKITVANLRTSLVGVNQLTLVGSKTYDPASTTNGSTWTTTVTVTGAAVGDVVVGVAHSSIIVATWRLDAVVSATNTVTVLATNNTGGTVDLASGTLRAVVLH